MWSKNHKNFLPDLANSFYYRSNWDKYTKLEAKVNFSKKTKEKKTKKKIVKAMNQDSYFKDSPP